MDSIKDKIYILIFGIIGFSIGIFSAGIIIDMNSKNPKWKGEPVIINCYGKDFSELQLVRAISFWTMLGDRIAFYEMSPSKNVCKIGEQIDGFIILRKAKPGQLKESTLASTTKRKIKGEIKSAVIYFKPGTQNLEYLIEHELGHAFGHNHVEEDGHIMNPKFEKMGPNF